MSTRICAQKMPEIEKQLEEINQGKKDIAAQLEASKQREEQLEKENSSYSEII